MVCGFLYSMLHHCCLIYVFCSLLRSNYSSYVSIIRFMFVLLFCMFCCLFCVFCVFVLFCVLFRLTYIAVSALFVYKSTDHCYRVETELLLINIT
jgi:hypothetical protein